MTSISKFIEQEIVVSSSQVINYCEKTLGLANSVARKRIQRLPIDIYKIKGICRDGQSILYHKSHWGTPEYFDALVDVLRREASQHFFVYNAIKVHRGIISKDRLTECSISPKENVIGHKNIDTIIKDLESLHLVEQQDDQYILKQDGYNETGARALDLIENITLEHFMEWGRNIGLFSYDTAKYHHTLSAYQYAIVAPSYLKTLIQQSKNGKTIPAFVIADILLNRNINENDVQFILHKLNNTIARNKTINIIPFLLIGTHHQEVYKALKTKGVIVGNIDELFGDKYSESIYGIMNLMENAGAILKRNPDQYLKLMDDIHKLATGKTYNLKGELFEMAVGYYHGQLCQSLEISKSIVYDNKIREIDVYAVYQDKIVFAECKGYNSKIEKDYIDKWLTEKVPVIRQWALSCDSIKDKNIVFEIWSTGGFTNEATTALENAQGKTKKYYIHFYDSNQMIRIAREKKMQHFVDIINKNYKKAIQ